MLNPEPSGAKLDYLCKGSNFTIQNWPRKSLENLSTTNDLSKVWANTRPMYACIIRYGACQNYFSMFLIIFEYAESNAERY